MAQIIAPAGLQQHPLSAAWPPMSSEAFQELRDSVQNVGVQNPITLYQGMVLDGWHRYTAATELTMDCPAAEHDAGIDVHDFVKAQNGARRNLTRAQLALAVVAMYEWHPADGSGQRAESSPEESVEQGGVTLNVTPPPKTNAELAEEAEVHPNTIIQAKAVYGAEPEVVDAVKRGEIGLPKAAAISKLPREEQVAALDKPMPKKPAKPHGKPKKVPAVKLIDAEIRAADAKNKLSDVEEELVALREQLAESRGQLTEAEALLELDSAERLAQALKDLQKERALSRGLQSRIDSMLEQIRELKGRVAYLEKKAGVPA